MPKKLKDIKDENETVGEEPKTSTKTPSVSDIQQRVKTKAEQQKVYLDSQPKVSILIPLEKGEKRGAVQPFCINGYKFNVPKGTMTQVPEQVAEMISERFDVELDVRSQAIGQRGEETKSALDV